MREWSWQFEGDMKLEMTGDVSDIVHVWLQKNILTRNGRDSGPGPWTLVGVVTIATHGTACYGNVFVWVVPISVQQSSCAFPFLDLSFLLNILQDVQDFVAIAVHLVQDVVRTGNFGRENEDQRSTRSTTKQALILSYPTSVHKLSLMVFQCKLPTIYPQ